MNRRIRRAQAALARRRGSHNGRVTGEFLFAGTGQKPIDKPHQSDLVRMAWRTVYVLAIGLFFAVAIIVAL